MKYILILILVSILCACGGPAPSTPSESDVQTAIAKTQEAQPVATNTPRLEASDTPKPTPTYTKEPSVTPRPSDTPIPSPTPTEEFESVEEIRTRLIELVTKFLEEGEGLEAVERVSVVRFGEPGVLEIEVNSVHSAKDNQPDLSYDIITFLAMAMGGENSEQLIFIGGGDDFIIQITTYSDDGDYRYQSDTNYETLIKLHDKQMTYEEWIVAADAGFR